MTQTVNINGQELELEQCVIDGDELDDVVSICGNTLLYPNGDVVELSDSEMDNYVTKVIEVPEDEQFIKEYIESNLDSQIDDQVFNKLLEELDKEVDVMPSAMSYSEWLNKTYYSKEVNSSLPITKSCTEYIYETYNTENNKTLYDKYLLGVRRELREWWFRNSKNALFVPDSREAWKEGDDLSYIQDPLIPENPIIKN